MFVQKQITAIINSSMKLLSELPHYARFCLGFKIYGSLDTSFYLRSSDHDFIHLLQIKQSCLFVPMISCSFWMNPVHQNSLPGSMTP